MTEKIDPVMKLARHRPGCEIPREASDEMIDAACAAVDDLYRVDAMRAIEAALAVLRKQGCSS